MYKPSALLSARNPGCLFFKLWRRYRSKRPVVPLKLHKVLIVAKMTRLEFERRLFKELSDAEFEKMLKQRGTDIDLLRYYQDHQKSFQGHVFKVFQNAGIEVEVANRLTLTEDKIDSADLVVPVGGDGTFLLAAGRVRNNIKPTMGINSDPQRSEGYLCLPICYSNNIEEIVKKLQNGQFGYVMRSRIKTSLITNDGDITPTYLNALDDEPLPPTRIELLKKDKCVALPALALNEVFVGEIFAARASHLKMEVDWKHEMDFKSSGVCVSTGTGSTSWHMSINRQSKQNIAELADLIGNCNIKDMDELSERYNRRLVFNCDEEKMAYTIRDMINARIWPQPKDIDSRGFAKTLKVTSMCYDASLVIDGGLSFPFKEGSVAILEIDEENALRTIVLED